MRPEAADKMGSPIVSRQRTALKPGASGAPLRGSGA